MLTKKPSDDIKMGGVNAKDIARTNALDGVERMPSAIGTQQASTALAKGKLDKLNRSINVIDVVRIFLRGLYWCVV